MDQAFESIDPQLRGWPGQGELRFSHIGTGALLVEAAGPMSIELQRRILAFADAVAGWPEFEETVPGVTNLMLVFGPGRPEDVGDLIRRLGDAWQGSTPKCIPSRVLEVPTIYGGEFATDLAKVAEHAGMSPAEVIEIHAAGQYTVIAVASSPGFGYLHGLDLRIACPRKKVPDVRMPKGVVTIGGMLTGVAVSTGPNGWNAIGYSDITLFDPAAPEPVRLRPGDRVRFVPEEIRL